VLTRRQRDILYLLALGKTNVEIARSLGLPEATVKFHLAALRRSAGTRRARCEPKDSEEI
jgi:DNA-binding NarL/FixJ family response regulator